jgi:hypothetical protein
MVAQKARAIAVMMRAFGDESADESAQRVFAVAAVIGSDDHWERLEPAWLARTKGIPFHANDCDSNHGDHAKADHQENKDLYRDLSIMLAESGLGGWGIAIDLLAQQRIFPGAPRELSYYRGFLDIVEKMKNCAAYNHETVQITFDTRQESEHNAGMLYGMARQAPGWQHFLFPEIGFAGSRENPRVQVADLFTREVMKALDNAIGPTKRKPRKPWVALRATDRFHADVLSDDWFAGLQEQMPQIESYLGMSMVDYARWLKDNRLIDNISNRFRYIASVIKRDGQ